MASEVFPVLQWEIQATNHPRSPKQVDLCKQQVRGIHAPVQVQGMCSVSQRPRPEESATIPVQAMTSVGARDPVQIVCECGTMADDTLHQLLAHSPGTEWCLTMPCPRPSAVDLSGVRAYY